MRRVASVLVCVARAHLRGVALVFVLLGTALVDGGVAAAPASAQAAPPLTDRTVAPGADCAPLACSQVKVAAPYILTFDQNHGGLTDKNGVGTGFTWVDKPTAGGAGFIPANLEVDTAAGLLKITTTAGIAFLGDNNQDNTLGVGIDAANQVSALETRLVNIPEMTGNLEQAGLWYGMNDDNYVKLVVISDLSGTLVQLLEERNGALQQQVVSPVISVSGAPVVLRMRADPLRRTITAYYSLNGGALQELKTLTVPGELFNMNTAGIDPAVGTRVFGGIFASDRFLQGTAVFQFDYFSLTAESQVVRRYLPVVTRP